MVKEITATNFDQEVKNAKLPVIIDFFAEWCGPCQQMAPDFNALAQEHENSYVFGKVNIDNERDLAVEHGISSIPTLIMFQNGERVGAQSGLLSKDEMQALFTATFSK